MTAKSSLARAQGSSFDSTHWSLILAARDRFTPEGEEALAELCARYWPPLYSYVRRIGHGVEDAQDLTQSFFSRILEKGYLDQVEEERGKFRSFLLASLKHFMANEGDRVRALKRGGAVCFLSLDAVQRAERDYRVDKQSAALTPEKLYEQSWALALLEQTTGRLASEYQEAGKSEIFAELSIFLTGDGAGTGYAQASAALEMNETAVRVAVHRLRRRFRVLLRAELARTIANPDDPGAIDREIRYLRSVL